MKIKFRYSYTLQNNTFSGLFVGNNIVTLNEVDSTNSYLKDVLSKSAPLLEGTVIMAEKQYAGRGQMDSTWLSEAGKNLTFSVLLNPSFLSIDRQFDLSKVVSLALNDMLSLYFGDSAKIKWPNDSYINNQKIGGILIENIIQGNRIKHAIIGIGLNVNQTDFEPALKNVTSFKKILNVDYKLASLLADICKAIEVRYLQLKAGKISEITTCYLQKLYLFNQLVSFKIGGEVKRSKIIGVSQEGKIKLETKGTIKEFGLKEIEFISLP
ncbi:MAG: biotin--[acetyl-CoA-carboxylase] ligase [Daejeonella sp.]